MTESDIKPVKTEIIDDKSLQLVGCVFYGDPFHKKEGWSEENEIGLTWQRFIKLVEENEKTIREIAINPEINYEIHIQPADYEKNKKFYVFVGVEVNITGEIPLEMFNKTLQATKYAKFTFKGKNMFRGGEYIWKEWLPGSDEYEEAHPYLIQVYDSNRFKGMDNGESELDYMIPVKKKNK